MAKVHRMVARRAAGMAIAGAIGVAATAQLHRPAADAARRTTYTGSMNFDRLPVSDLLDDEYTDVAAPGVGLDFNGTWSTVAPVGVMAHSTPNVVVSWTDPTLITAVGGTFNRIGAWFVGGGPNPLTVTVTAYDAEGNALASEANPMPYNQWRYVEFTLNDTGGVPIASFGSAGTAGFYAMDDLSYSIVTTGAPACVEDLNGDGRVDGADLARLLGAWGECR